MRPKYVCNSESFRVSSHTAHQAGRHLAHHAHPKPTGPVLCKKRGADRTPALGAHLPVTVPQLPAGSVSSASQRPRVKIRKLDLIAYSYDLEYIPPKPIPRSNITTVESTLRNRRQPEPAARSLDIPSHGTPHHYLTHNHRASYTSTTSKCFAVHSPAATAPRHSSLDFLELFRLHRIAHVLGAD